jgi:hypothetical protein
VAPEVSARHGAGCGRARFVFLGFTIHSLPAVLIGPRVANATDFYEIQIYSFETSPPGQLMAELHLNYISTPVGVASKSNLPLYRAHAS